MLVIQNNLSLILAKLLSKTSWFSPLIVNSFGIHKSNGGVNINSSNEVSRYSS